MNSEDIRTYEVGTSLQGQGRHIASSVHLGQPGEPCQQDSVPAWTYCLYRHGFVIVPWQVSSIHCLVASQQRVSLSRHQACVV